ncbi:hypothetical protein B0T13DRAFT_448592 [Neurospora crassa]|nr:hypothetical protein B0T13DRAFT_448592 [Neurospora crassa]
MASQTSTKLISCHEKPGTTPASPMPVNHPRKQRHHHHDVRFDLAAMSLSISRSSQVQADSSSQFPTRTSSSSGSYTKSTSSPASLSNLPTLAKLEPSRTSPPKSNLESQVSSSSPSAKPASEEAQTNQGPPCNNCHQPSTLCTVGPLNPKGNAGRKYFACKRCPYGLAWVGWAGGESFDKLVVVAAKDEGVDPSKNDCGDGVDSVPGDAGSAGGGSNADREEMGDLKSSWESQ